MIIDILNQYSDIIETYNILKFNLTESSYCLVYEVELTDAARLFARDYLFQDGTRKYSFHWQGADGDCIVRWDNAPHHQGVSSFPYHQHRGKEERVEESQPMKLEKVLEHIRKQIVCKEKIP